ncbi:unnamed protein product [Linum tenue]|uniref:Uncharacterized protein n=1 Tax=Linum tenue TaxID=586396 RepID=A0AAV0IX20_9ROSI|nr:unnamed protein product [Linum tenue]
MLLSSIHFDLSREELNHRNATIIHWFQELLAQDWEGSNYIHRSSITGMQPLSTGFKSCSLRTGKF